MIRILVCGGRDFGDTAVKKEDTALVASRIEEYRFIIETLNKLSVPYQDGMGLVDAVIMQGGARGADRVASDWAAVNYCECLEYKADWNKHGKSAGYIRNKQMLDEGKPDLVVAFPGGKGTRNMVELAAKAGIKVVEYAHEKY